MNQAKKKKMYAAAFRENEDYEWISSMLLYNMTNYEEAMKLILEIESATSINYAEYNKILKKLHKMRLSIEGEYFVLHQIRTNRLNYHQITLEDLEDIA